MTDMLEQSAPTPTYLNHVQAKDNIFQGRNQFIFKGATAWLASLLITILAFAMLRFMGWEEKWKRRLGEAAKKVSEMACM